MDYRYKIGVLVDKNIDGEYDRDIINLVYKLLPEIDSDHKLVFGKHLCSDYVVDKCIYNEDMDPEHECCIFCGEGENRNEIHNENR